MDKRHLKRTRTIQQLFALSFGGTSSKNLGESEHAAKDIVKNKKKIDSVIQKYVLRYPLEKIAKIDLAILRLAIYELLYERKNPTSVVIDEAVELAKEFGSERSFSFINGVLAGVARNELQHQQKN